MCSAAATSGRCARRVARRRLKGEEGEQAVARGRQERIGWPGAEGPQPGLEIFVGAVS